MTEPKISFYLWNTAQTYLYTQKNFGFLSLTNHWKNEPTQTNQKKFVKNKVLLKT